MISIAPSTLHGTDDSRLENLVATLAGERLVGVRYVPLSGASWANYSDLDGVHEVDMAVELVTGSGLSVRVSWATPGREEGLWLTLGPEGERTSGDPVDVDDVSGHHDWSAILGSLVETVAVAFLRHGYDSSVRPWSFRIGFSGGSSVTVALGETASHRIHYMPTTLVVIFDEATARTYEVVDALQPAWGENVRVPRRS